MIFENTGLAGLYLVTPDLIRDERGFFARTFADDEFRARGLHSHFPQCSISYNERSATLRGMHYQAEPYAEAKLVRCTGGAIYDVALDLRKSSDTYLAWYATKLTAENRRALYIPEGFAHGFQTLVDGSEIFYQISAPFVASSSHGVRWDDPRFGIEWPSAADRIISDRDRSLPDFRP